MLGCKIYFENCYFSDTDTDFSESEALSSMHISGQAKSPQANLSETDGGKNKFSFYTKFYQFFSAFNKIFVNKNY